MSLQTSLPSFELWANFVSVRSAWEDEVPLDEVCYSCNHCEEIVKLNPNGVFIINEAIEEPLPTVLNNIETYALEEHITDSEDCPGDNFEIVAYPENIVFMFPATRNHFIQPVELEGQKYVVDTLIHPREDVNTSILVLYKKENISHTTYHDFVHNNFDSHFKEEVYLENLTTSIEEIVFDDDTANQYRHLLPRMEGGGRSNNQHFNYVCKWCPAKKLEGAQTGRFLEFRNYRDHFKRVHSDIPFGEFLQSVKRRDQKYLCNNCNKTISLRSVTYHKAICKNDNSSDDDTDESEKEERSKKHRKPKKRKPWNQIQSSDSDDSDTRKAKRIDSQKSCSSKATQATQKTLSISQSSQTNNDDNMIISENGSRTLLKKIKKTANNTWTIVSEGNNNDERSRSPAGDKMEETENEYAEEEASQDDGGQENNAKWWTTISDDIFCDKGYPGLPIFYNSDDEEFVNRVIQNWKDHEAKKVILDKRMEENENSDAMLKKFSSIRDEPILDEYTDFAKNSSLKTVLDIFSADYAENNNEAGAKASTAKTYSNRIVEFFKFMASSYADFHLDWFTDYSGLIEKTDPNNEKTYEIFVPTNNDLQKFIKQYHYGTNPAANVGLRIFAIKKFLDFLIQKYKENEHCFPGSLKDKSSMVECLIQKLRNLNQAICPDGIIKKISIASNRNHKQALIEQMSQCPEKSTKNIMDGVAKYLKSEEYSMMKTKLMEFAYKKCKIPTSQDYMQVTKWLLEQLICLGGNRPCALLGITVGKTYFSYNLT